MKIKFFRRKVFLRLFSLCAGIFIWMYVVSSAEIEVNKEIPISIEVPDGLAIKNEFNPEVVYRVKGPGLFVRKFLDKSLKIQISKSKYYTKRKYKYNIKLDSFKFKLPLGVELISMEPRNLAITLERSITKRIAVRPIFSDQINEQYHIKELKIFPKKIEVTGPKSVVRNIDFLETKPIEELKIEDEDGFFVNIVNPDSRVNIKDTAVNISFTLKSKITNKEFGDIPITFQSIGLIKSALPQTVSIKVSGEEDKIKAFSRESIHVIALIPNDTHGKAEIELITELPQGIKLVELSPKKVRVNLE